MPDERTKREKLEAWLAPGSGKEESEKEIARAWLAAHPAPRRQPQPGDSPFASYEPPTGADARPAGRQWTAYRAYRDPDAGPDDPLWVDEDFFDGASFQARSFSGQMNDINRRARSFQDEILSAFSRLEQDAIRSYMEGKINQAELKERLRRS